MMEINDWGSLKVTFKQKITLLFSVYGKHHCAMICALINDSQVLWYIYLVIP